MTPGGAVSAQGVLKETRCCRGVPDRSINLTFHGIGEPGRRLEPGERDVWVSREQFYSLLDCAVGRKDVVITFDDGNASDLELALPALHDRGLTATFFVVAGRLGASRFLDEAGVRAVAAAGMEIGCHGMHHRHWRGLDEAALHEELVEAKAVLEETVEQQVTQAACPFGSYDRRVLRALRGYGYRHVFTSDRGLARPGDFLQPRNSVGPYDPPGLLAEIPARDTSLSRALRRRVKLAVKRWR
jgi:peptidoglycan/xylan/chitin deacetylase (PgdA/CDA1 family)